VHPQGKLKKEIDSKINTELESKF